MRTSGKQTRSKWPSKNNVTELDISQSLDWQCPSLSPYFLLIQLICYWFFSVLMCKLYKKKCYPAVLYFEEQFKYLQI